MANTSYIFLSVYTFLYYDDNTAKKSIEILERVKNIFIYKPPRWFY